MRPQDLKPPFSWNERQVILADRVLYVPEHYEHYEQFDLPQWNDAQLCGNDQPRYLEYCSGNGTWILDRAKKNPLINWLSVEIQFQRAKKIIAKRENQKLDNLFIICGEAYIVTHHFIPSESIDQIFINFPDPWPKRRHAKHRLIQPAFVAELARILVPHGKVTLVTDDQPYSQIMIDEMRQNPLFESLYPDPYYTGDYPNYGTSFFDQLWRQKGRFIYYHCFTKTALQQL